jgi:hypothetical protein
MFEPIWKRDYHRLEVEGSPVFDITISDLAASATMFYGMEHRTGIMDYLPMNMIRIVNKGGTNLAIYLNDATNYEVILADTIYTHRGNVHTFKLENLSAVAAATGTSIFCTVQHEPLEA